MTRFLALALLALTACSPVAAQPAPREVVSQAPVCARRMASGEVVEGPEVCSSTPGRRVG